MTKDISILNQDKLEALAARIEHEEHVRGFFAAKGFDMSFVTHDCGSPACIAGYAVDEAKQAGYDLSEEQLAEIGYRHSYHHAVSWLTDGKQWKPHIPGNPDAISFQSLFDPYVSYSWELITPVLAAKVIRHFAATGEVDWSIIRDEINFDTMTDQ